MSQIFPQIFLLFFSFKKYKFLVNFSASACVCGLSLVSAGIAHTRTGWRHYCCAIVRAPCSETRPPPKSRCGCVDDASQALATKMDNGNIFKPSCSITSEQEIHVFSTI
jgi:hypothetical protein